MKTWLFVALAGLLVAGCMPYPMESMMQLTETEAQMVSGCAKLGMISENADADNPFAYDATHRMIYKVKQRAVQLGATHIVWLHKTAHSAAAVAYRCPSQ